MSGLELATVIAATLAGWAAFAALLGWGLRRQHRRELDALLSRRRWRFVDEDAWHDPPPAPLRRPWPWWVRTRPDPRGTQIDGQGLEPIVECYVPWWGRPPEFVARCFR